MEEKSQELRYIVRIANTDLVGSKNILFAMGKIKGISVMLANAFLGVAGIEKDKRAGALTDAEIQKLNDVISNPAKYNIPEWLFNRRKDPETGEDIHLLAGDLRFNTENDIKLMKKTRSYKGIRHSLGLTVRGQRTKANFRRNKGRVSLGVQRKKTEGGAAADSKGKK
ncbi:30S ribosomal protein S13 [Candidatus Woesearchaeota archaeon]|nr:30S ribosomal protein S13 [Candidatus Woesearchaeota archaeon]